MTVKSIHAGKKNEPKCPYCGLVPASEHPDFTCPRLAGATFGDGETTVDFVDPQLWELIKRDMLSED
ncbi:MAG: hypothetical protein AAGI88_25905 [Pseudomonadota bacterium]